MQVILLLGTIRLLTDAWGHRGPPWLPCGWAASILSTLALSIAPSDRSVFGWDSLKMLLKFLPEMMPAKILLSF